MRTVFTETRSVAFNSQWPNLDTTDAITVFYGDLDVPIVTPVAATGVLDEPVLLAVIVVAPADGEHTVIKVGSAIIVVHDTMRVELRLRAGINRDSKRLKVEGGLKLANVVTSDVSP